jgi:predicted nucleotidyltransferase
MINRTQQEVIIRYLQPIRPNKIGVFGSFARGENRKESDLDILIYLDKSNKISLLDLIGAEQELSKALGIKVDLITERSLNPLLRPYVEKDLRIIKSVKFSGRK